MRYKSLLLLLCLYSLLITVTTTKAVANTPPPARTAVKEWCIVVQDMINPNREDTQEDISAHSWSQGDEYRTKWKTIIANGSKFKSHFGLICVVNKTPAFLKVKTLTHKYPLRGASFGRQDFVSYQVDQLMMQSLTAKKGVAIAGQAELAEARKSVLQILKTPSSDASIMPYQYLLNPLSLTANTISFEMRTNTPGGVHPLHDAAWRTIAIKNGYAHAVKASALQPSLLKEGNKLWSQLKHTDNSLESYTEALNNFILLPCHKGIEVQWAFPCAEAAGRGSLYVLDVKPSPRQIGAHQKQFDYDYNSSLAPDGSVLVSWKSGNLFWQSPPSAKPKFLGHVENPRGWQWLAIKTLSTREKKLLGL